MTRNNKLLLGCVTLLLLFFVAFQEVVLNSMSVETAFRIGTLWGLIKFVLAVVLWRLFNTWVKARAFWMSGKTEEYKPVVSPLFVILVVVLGAAAGFLMNWRILENQSYIDLNLFYRDLILCWFFTYIAILIIVRNLLISLVKIISGKGAILPRRIAAGFSDGILILLHPVGFILYRIHYAVEESAGMSSGGYFRLLIMGAVLAALRIAWGFVPEDRLEIVREFIDFLRERKLWWMTPIFIVLGFLIILVLLTQSTGSFPFIYAIF